jgi:hypothetical protein
MGRSRWVYPCLADHAGRRGPQQCVVKEKAWARAQQRQAGVRRKHEHDALGSLGLTIRGVEHQNDEVIEID